MVSPFKNTIPVKYGSMKVQDGWHDAFSLTNPEIKIVLLAYDES
jgi:hypothetical protein